jgi:hypothetical protein
MNIAAVMDELGDALGAIDGLRVFPYSAPAISPPAAIVGWPEPITYDSTMARGMDELSLPVWVLVGKVDARTSRDALAAYLDGSGGSSVKAAIDGGTYTACDSVRVTSATVEAITSGGVEYLGAVLQVEITGQGA